MIYGIDELIGFIHYSHLEAVEGWIKEESGNNVHFILPQRQMLKSTRTSNVVLVGLASLRRSRLVIGLGRVFFIYFFPERKRIHNLKASLVLDCLLDRTF